MAVQLRSGFASANATQQKGWGEGEGEGGGEVFVSLRFQVGDPVWGRSSTHFCEIRL